MLAIDVLPPRYKLLPITPPSFEKRYSSDPARFPQSCVEVIHPGMDSRLRSQAPPYTQSTCWTLHTHPEGKTYWAKGQKPCVLTEYDVSKNDVLDLIMECTSRVLGLAKDQDVEMKSTVELFLEPLQDTRYCGYYLVDHGERTIFWLESVDYSAIDLQVAHSEQSLKLILEEQYWRHVSQFGVHMTSLPGALDELIAIYTHARADQLISAESTFPWSPDTTKGQLDLLIQCREVVNSAATICVVAQMWTFVVESRNRNYYGETFSRLGRTIHIDGDGPQKPHIIYRFLSALMFKGPENTRRKLDNTWADGVLIAYVWKMFVEEQMAEWKTSTYLTLALTGCKLLWVVNSPSGDPLTGDVMIATVAIFIHVVLYERFSLLVAEDAVDTAAIFLGAYKRNTMPLAVICAIPRAMSIWSLVYLLGQVIAVSTKTEHPVTSAARTFIVSGLILSTIYHTFPSLGFCDKFSLISKVIMSRQRTQTFSA